MQKNSVQTWQTTWSPHFDHFAMVLELDLIMPCGDITLEEQLDVNEPLRHLMQPHDDELEGVIASEGLARASTSMSELLTVLPQQSHSVANDNGLLKLLFSHEWDGLPNPLEISLVVDAAPGCGGLAWPAGQVWS